MSSRQALHVEMEHGASPAFIMTLAASLYFAQGLPIGLLFGAYPVLLRSSGAPLSFVAWLPLLGLPWMLKFLWSPLVDNHWSAALGRRRTWLLSQQLLMIAALIALASMGIAGHVALPTLALLGAASFFAATQDIATDGLAAEMLEGKQLAYANALSVGGMALGTLAGGGGVLMLSDNLGTRVALLAVTALLMLCLIPVALWRENPQHNDRPSDVAALKRVATRPHFYALLLLAGVFALPHSAEGAIAKLYLVDAGWRIADIGALESLSMGAMTVLGCGGAAWLISRFGALPGLIAGTIIITATSLAWFALSTWQAHDLWSAVPAFLRVMSGAGGGLATVAVFTLAMQFARGGSQAGTDVTVFKSANVLGEMSGASLATALAATAGYAGGFALSAAAGVLVLLLVITHKTLRNFDVISRSEGIR